MNNIDMRTVVAIVVAVCVVVALAAWAHTRRRRSRQLQERFGPEYDRVVLQHGDVRRAETVLETREKRVERLEIRSLPESARERYAQHWLEVQRRFVDDPRMAVTEADGLVMDVMSARGYPMGDFQQRAADVSVDHPQLVENYRMAHDIALRRNRGEANTEDLRKAMVYYRLLFDELLGRPSERREVA